MPTQHHISINTLLDTETNLPICGGRVIFARLPFYHHLHQQPGSKMVHQVFSRYGPITKVEQIDAKGGFYVTLGSSLPQALQTANSLYYAFQGRANLDGDPACEEQFPIHEDICGALFGHRGENLRRVKALSGADIEVTPWCGEKATRTVIINGTPDQIDVAIGHVNEAVLLVNEREKAARMALSEPRPLELTTTAAVAIDTTHQNIISPSAAQANHINQSKMIVPIQRTYSSEFPRLDTHKSDIDRMPQQSIKENINQAASRIPSCVPVVDISLADSSTKLVLSSADRASMIMKAHWCLLKDRLTLVKEIRDAVCIFWEVKAQESRLNNGLKFGVRSKSWAHFVKADSVDDRSESMFSSSACATISTISLSRALSSNMLIAPSC